MMRLCIGVLMAVAVTLFAGTAFAEEAAAMAKQAPVHYVAPDGKRDNAGTKDAPWDIASALDGSRKIAPGATIYLRGGVYRRRPQELFTVTLTGAADQPIHIRPVPGERVTIDGGLRVVAASYVWIWDLELMVSEPNPVGVIEKGSHPRTFERPHGGLQSGNAEFDMKGCKFINLVIHHCRQGVSWWVGATDSELYGCIIYDNGWWGTDRGHGHAIYTQNREGTKTISDCIMTGGYSYTMHAYGSGRAYVDNFLITGNICYDSGMFLVGGGRPSNNCRIVGNSLYNTQMRIGYSAKGNRGVLIEDNVVVHRPLDVYNYISGTMRGNLIVNGALRRFSPEGQLVDNGRVLKPLEGDEMVWEKNELVSTEEARKREPLIVLRPNQYDPRRANLAIFNWRGALVVQFDAAKFLADGDRYELRDPKQFFGDPVQWGYCEKGRITVPMFGHEFAAYVMIKRPAEEPVAP